MANNIYVISFSPAFDYILELDKLVLGKTNRTKATDMYPAGKGIHVSMILNSLSVDSESIIFSDGDFEGFFYKGLDKVGVKYKKFKAQGDIRFNLKLIDEYQTECSVKSAPIATSEIEKFMKYLEKTITKGDYVVATGSLPQGLDEAIYGRITKLANSLGARCIVDSSGKSLNFAVEAKPFLIKPNSDELEMSTGLKISSEKDIIAAANILLKKGVQNILVSMGADGAMFINSDMIIKSNIGSWNKQLVNAAGAGDSMLGGFLSEYIKTNSYESALKMGIVCGSATAYSKRIASSELIKELAATINNLKITKLK